MFGWLLNLFRGQQANSHYVPSPPHPANVPGPFYVQEGCCISCGVWEDVAPDLLSWLEDADGKSAHCYVSRQPQTDEEFQRMKSAMSVGEVDCIRVRSCKAEWLDELRQAGFGDQIDLDKSAATTHL